MRSTINMKLRSRHLTARLVTMTARKYFAQIVLLFAFTQVNGCAVFAVADAVVTTAATAVKVTVKAVGAAADLVIPDSSKKEEKNATEKK